MLARRGFRPTPAPLDLPFPADLDEATADALAARLGHYGFRLFLRGAIQRSAGFVPGEATRYLNAAQARECAQELVELGLAAPTGSGGYRLLFPAHSFGGTLEWYVARELRRRLGFDVLTGLKFRYRGVGGDLDLAASADGRLAYLELKSSPPRHLGSQEVAAFFDRLQALRPDLALFVMDTALRLSDKALPMLEEERRRRWTDAAPPRRVLRELWQLGEGLYAVNAQPDLMANVGRALAEGLRARSPWA
jgi:hypothetical protein